MGRVVLAYTLGIIGSILILVAFGVSLGLAIPIANALIRFVVTLLLGIAFIVGAWRVYNGHAPVE